MLLPVHNSGRCGSKFRNRRNFVPLQMAGFLVIIFAVAGWNYAFPATAAAHTAVDMNAQHRRLMSSNGSFNGTCLTNGVLTAEALANPELTLTGGPLSITGAMSGQVPCNLATCSGETCCGSIDNAGGVVLHLLITLYTFLGLAIICDDYFCESLEKISEALKLSDDVAGATFMAAGSSAPELFTAVVTVLITGGAEGLGTIVGSAIFNIMVIVGVTAICAGTILEVWWYPLTRDCIVYVISIIMMVIFMWDSYITTLEAALLMSGYVFYILLMVKNEKIVSWVQKKSVVVEPSTPGASGLSDAAAIAEMARKLRDGAAESASKPRKEAFFEKDAAASTGSAGDPSSPVAAPRLPPLERTSPVPMEVVAHDKVTPLTANGQAVVDLFTSGSSMGNANAVDPSAAARKHSNPLFRPAFRRSVKQDVNKARAKDRSLFGTHMGTTLKVTRASELFMRSIHKSSGTSFSNSLAQASKLAAESMGGDEEAENPIPASAGTGGAADHQAAKAAAAYKSLDLEQKKAAAEEEEEEGGPLGKVLEIISVPLLILFKYTIPDLREEKYEKYYMACFTMSVLWIGILSFLMVDFAARAGCILRIPGVLMGLTIIAAGTSVPDALSSVLVAQNGQGDMAVANVLGSNVFNIFLGLGFPWLCKTLMDGAPLYLGKQSVVLSTCILLLYVVVFIVVIYAANWKLSRRVGYSFFFAHGIFLVWNVLTMMPNPVIKINL